MLSKGWGPPLWTIKPEDKKDELIFGIGATTDVDGKPILGLTSIFKGDGKYILGKASSTTNMKNYLDKLEEVITTSINYSLQNGILGREKKFYLIFHIYKPAGKDHEVRALKRVIDKFSQYSFEYAFVHIGHNHNFRFFTKLEQRGNIKHIDKVGENQKGTLLKITDGLGFLGLQPNSSSFYKIDIHRQSTFFDLNYISEQIYQFAEMSHTSYKEESIPITIKYPRLMAQFFERFNEGKLMYLDDIEMPDQSLWFL